MTFFLVSAPLGTPLSLMLQWTALKVKVKVCDRARDHVCVRVCKLRYKDMLRHHLQNVGINQDN